MTTQLKAIKVAKDSQPASCPPKGTPAWDMHPRVYLEFNVEKKANCPYCGNQFELTN